MEGISDPQLSPEDLRHYLEDPPSLTLPHIGEGARENATEPTSENVTITEEALQENQETASEEAESPGLDFEFIYDVEAVRKKFRGAPNGAKIDWARNSKWFKVNEATTHNPYYDSTARSKFTRRILRCKKPKLFLGSINEEPCNSPAYRCCDCSPRSPITPKMPWDYWDQALR